MSKPVAKQGPLGGSDATAFAAAPVQDRSGRRDTAAVRDTVVGPGFVQAFRPVDLPWDLRDEDRPGLPKIPGPEVREKDDETRHRRRAARSDTLPAERARVRDRLVALEGGGVGQAAARAGLPEHPGIARTAKCGFPNRDPTVA